MTRDSRRDKDLATSLMTKSNLPVGRRELTRAHIAFYRAVMDGIDARRAWELYLSADGDFSELLCTATLGWVRQALIGEAVAANQPGLIGLFRRDPRQVKGTAKPTLTEFAARFEDAGDWSESELTAMWKDEFGGPDPTEVRRERLGKRLRQALQLLEKATRKAPHAGDPVSQWLAPNLAEHLIAAGFDTLGRARIALYARRSPRWEEVPGVGEVWADRLRVWFDQNGLSTAPSPAAVRPPALMVPLERFEPPALLSPMVALSVPGLAEVRSPYPAQNNALGARDDKHAVELWLAAKAENPNTLRSYRKNAERLLLWCYLERKTTFPELKVEDCIHYRTWLNDLGKKSPTEWAEAGWRLPAEEWFSKKRAAKRDSELWRPFDGPLSPNSVVQDLLTVRSLFEFLVRGHILSLNPWDLLGKRARTRANLENATEQFVGRSFTMDQWKVLVGEIDPHGSEIDRRLLVILWLGFACGLRASEMLSLTLGSLIPGTESWRLSVLGKGDKVRTVPLPSPARDALLSYLDSVGLPYDEVVRISQGPVDRAQEELERSRREKALPILRGQRGRRSAGRAAPEEPLHYSRLYMVLKAHLRARAEGIAKTDPVGSGKFRRASAHWLRHTCATLALKNGVELPGVQRLLGHSTLTVTSTYVTAQDEALQASMEVFANRGAE